MTSASEYVVMGPVKAALEASCSYHGGDPEAGRYAGRGEQLTQRLNAMYWKGPSLTVQAMMR